MSKTIEFVKNVDRGFYHAAKAAGLSPGTYLARQVEPEQPEIDPVYQRMLKRFEQPDNGSYRSRALYSYAEEVTALEKCLTQAGIRAQGPYTDTVEKAFYTSANNTALFPVFFATQIIAGQLATSLVPRLAAMEERINSHVAQKITMTETASARQLKFTGEGANLPKTTISTSEGNVTLYKYGRLLEATYESIRLQHLDVFGTFMQRMGSQIGIDETDDLIEVLIAGDGTTSSGVTDTDAEVSGTLDFDELIRLKQSFPLGYKGNEGVINDTLTRTICNMPEFKDPQGPVGVGNFDDLDRINILGMNLNRWTSTAATSFSTDRILVVDSRFAVKVLREGDFLEESDSLIDKQINRRAMSEWVGYMKLDLNGTQCLDVTA